VGLGVGPDSLRGGQPATLDVVPALDTTTMVPETGREIRPTLGGTVPAWRFLVGHVNDPVGGEIEAEGYFDVLSPSSIPAPIRTETDPDSVTAQLRLEPTYLHGIKDSVGIEVQSLTEEAEMNRAPADTSFPAGAAATDGPVSISPTDTLVTIDLSASWLTPDRLATLRDTSQEFHGFKLTASNSEAVVGFSSTSATLRLTHKRDSSQADYTSFKSFSHIERVGPPSSPPPASHLLLQAGTGTGLAMDWQFDESPLDTLRNAPLNRAEIYVPVDSATLANETDKQNFVRPLPKGFRMIATRHPDESTPECSQIFFQLLPFSDANEACLLPLVPAAAPGAALVSDNVAFPIFDQSLRRLGTSIDDQSEPPVLTTFRVFIADRENTSINTSTTIQPGLPSTVPVLVQKDDDSSGPGPPRATLTVTPL
jgi:hypothetical protein